MRIGEPHIPQRLLLTTPIFYEAFVDAALLQVWNSINWAVTAYFAMIGRGSFPSLRINSLC